MNEQTSRNEYTAGTVPLRLASTKLAAPPIWNGNTSMATFAVSTAGKLSLGGIIHRLPVPMQQRAAETENAVTLADPYLHDVLDRLLGFVGLPRDWDGQGAEPIDETAVATAIGVLRFLIDQARACEFALPRPAVSPSPGGSVGFEWEQDDNVLTIDCRSRYPVHVYQSNRDNEIERDVDSLPALWVAVQEFLSSSI